MAQTEETAAETQKVLQRLAVAVRQVCPAWLTPQIDDIVQQAWLRVAESLRNREGKGAVPSSYLWKVAYCATVDEIRKARRLREEHLDEDRAEAVGGMDLNDPERQCAGKEVGLAIRQCVKGVIAPRRRPLTLYLLGHGVRECSALIGENYKRTENLILRGLADLRSCLMLKGLNP